MKKKQEPTPIQKKQVVVDLQVAEFVSAQGRYGESFNDVLRRVLGLDIEQRGEQGRPDRRQRTA